MKLGSKIGTAFLGLFLLVGVCATAGTVSAQGRYDRGRYDQDRYGNDVRRIAEDQGFKDGIWEGGNRARDRKSYDPYRTNSYKKAIDGYNKSMGDKYYYQQAYRQGYLRGYDEGYHRGGNYRGYRPY
jgi:hypothetical protein